MTRISTFFIQRLRNDAGMSTIEYAVGQELYLLPLYWFRCRVLARQ